MKLIREIALGKGLLMIRLNVEYLRKYAGTPPESAGYRLKSIEIYNPDYPGGGRWEPAPTWFEDHFERYENLSDYIAEE